MPRIAAALIVRDEADNIVRCLDAAERLVETVVIDDTGSTDGTQQIIRDWGRRNGVKVSLREWEWQNFKVNRTALMERAASFGDWLLLLDADMVLHVPDPFPSLDGADVWHGSIDSYGMDYTLPMLVRASKPWYYEGVAHSYLACREDFDESVMSGLWVEDYSHTSVAKLERDLVALSEEHARNPLDRRTIFYLAQTYYDLDRFQEAVIYYRMRSEMGGWDEEVYFARYRLGCILAEHFSFAQGARVLLGAWESRPQRVEALRALAGAATSVANKQPLPPDRLFIGTRSYEQHALPQPVAPPMGEHGIAAPMSPKGATGVPLPPFPNIAPTRLRRRPRVTARKGLNRRDVSAVIVTRGNVDLGPTLEPILAAGLGELVVWNNAIPPGAGPTGVTSYRIIGGADYGCFGRYAAIPKTKNPVIAWVDDDVVFTAWDALLAAYEPGRLVCNMDESWIDGAGYRGVCGMQGAGSLCDADIPAKVWAQYLAAYPWDEESRVEADFVFGALVPFTVIDIGYDIREFADDPDRTYMQPGQTERKHAMIDRCRELLAVEAAA